MNLIKKRKMNATYRAMLARCYNTQHVAWKNYGGRGIKVCARWKSSFDNFYEDMHKSHRIGLTLERKNNDLGYSKNNCRWASRAQQNRNRRDNVFITIRGKKVLLIEAAEKRGLKLGMVYSRRAMGWPDEKLLLPVYATLGYGARIKYANERYVK